MVKKGQLPVSKADSPRQGEERNPDESRVKHQGRGSRGQSRAKPPSEGSSKG